jgi:hypothetical protein
MIHFISLMYANFDNCFYYQEFLISWILWELCPFELRNFPKFTTGQYVCVLKFICITLFYLKKKQLSKFAYIREKRGITPTKFRRSKIPGNMHNYIWFPYYPPSFMKFCSVVSEELPWQTVWWTGGRTGQKQCLLHIVFYFHHFEWISQQICHLEYFLLCHNEVSRRSRMSRLIYMRYRISSNRRPRGECIFKIGGGN